MADRPILFSAPMVRALLEGRKTQTRRVLKPQPHDNDFCGPGLFHPTRVDRHGEEHPGPAQFGIWAPDGFWTQRLPYAPRDLLWVREAWNVFSFSQDGEVAWPCKSIPTAAEQAADEELAVRGVPQAVYRESDRAREWFKDQPWRPGIHMPRWASRLTLLVTDVRVQRLQDISEADALAEGIHRFDDGWHWQPNPDPPWMRLVGIDPVKCFSALWNSINGPDAWAANPWVAAISFEVVRANIDQAQP